MHRFRVGGLQRASQDEGRVLGQAFPQYGERQDPQREGAAKDSQNVLGARALGVVDELEHRFVGDVLPRVLPGELALLRGLHAMQAEAGELEIRCALEEMTGEAIELSHRNHRPRVRARLEPLSNLRDRVAIERLLAVIDLVEQQAQVVAADTPPVLPLRVGVDERPEGLRSRIPFTKLQQQGDASPDILAQRALRGATSQRLQQRGFSTSELAVDDQPLIFAQQVVGAGPQRLYFFRPAKLLAEVPSEVLLQSLQLRW